MLRASIQFLRTYAFLTVALVLLLLAAIQATYQYQEWRYLQDLCGEIVEQANAKTPEEKTLAICAYLRANVRFQDAPVDDRPFLRATAAETLLSKRGYCGEGSRAFICMADAVGLKAQRINLHGAKPHVVAEVEFPNGEAWIVDCQNPPRYAGMMSLDEIIATKEYEDYSTLNLRRLGVHGVVTRLKLQIGSLTYWIENPHAILAFLYTTLAIGFLMIRPLRGLMRKVLRKRGWIHQTDTAELQKALEQQQPMIRRSTRPRHGAEGIKQESGS